MRLIFYSRIHQKMVHIVCAIINFWCHQCSPISVWLCHVHVRVVFVVHLIDKIPFTKVRLHYTCSIIRTSIIFHGVFSLENGSCLAYLLLDNSPRPCRLNAFISRRKGLVKHPFLDWWQASLISLFKVWQSLIHTCFLEFHQFSRQSLHIEIHRPVHVLV